MNFSEFPQQDDNAVATSPSIPQKSSTVAEAENARGADLLFYHKKANLSAAGGGFCKMFATRLAEAGEPIGVETLSIF